MKRYTIKDYKINKTFDYTNFEWYVAWGIVFITSWVGGFLTGLLF